MAETFAVSLECYRETYDTACETARAIVEAEFYPGEVVPGPLVIAQSARFLYWVVVDQITWQTRLAGAGEWVPRELRLFEEDR